MPDAVEGHRLDALCFLQLLDTPPEQAYDRYVQLAAALLQVPIALFSLVDECRQWFKASTGLAARETPRDVAFCSVTIQGHEPLLIEDALLDTRFADNALVTGPPNVRFYFGIPIRTIEGHAIGTLCCIDTSPRQVTPQQRAALGQLAALLSDEVRLREKSLRDNQLASRLAIDLDATTERFRAVFERSNIGMAIVAPDGAFNEVNRALCDMVGYAPAELLALTFQDITHPDDLHADLSLLAQLTAGDIDHYALEKRYRHRRQHDVWINLHVSATRSENGKVEYYVAVIDNIDLRKQAQMELSSFHASLEERIARRTQELEDANLMLRNAMSRQLYAEAELRQREAELSNVIEYANDAYVSMDRHGIVRAWNRMAEEIFGWRAGEAIGKHLSRLIVPEHLRQAHQEGLLRYVASGRSSVLGRRMELPAIRKDGAGLFVEIRIHVVDAGGEPIFSAFLHDITERKAQEAEREHEIMHDALTGLPNRRAFHRALDVTQARAARRGLALAVLFIDLDGFKTVNDTFGHGAGDALLREIAARLQDTLRRSDQAFRLAGDEFTVIVECRRDAPDDAHRVADKIIGAVSKPVQVAGTALRVGASIGIALDDTGTRPIESLMEEADRYMYEAKRAGRGTVRPRL